MIRVQMGFSSVCTRTNVHFFGNWLIFHKCSRDAGENWTGISAPQCRDPVTHRETLPVPKESEEDVGCERGAEVMIKVILPQKFIFMI